MSGVKDRFSRMWKWHFLSGVVFFVSFYLFLFQTSEPQILHEIFCWTFVVSMSAFAVISLRIFDPDHFSARRASCEHEQMRCRNCGEPPFEG